MDFSDPAYLLAYVIALPMTYGPTALIAYFIGSVPFGFILTKLFLKQDIRNIGSGNIGATNVLRSGSKPLAIATLLLDSLKGVLAIFFFYFSITHSADPVFNASLCGLFAIIGHCFPVWLKFKGGKGVATSLGVLLAAVPWAGFVAMCTWGIVAGFSRLSSLAALSAAAIAPVATLLIYGFAPALITAFIAALVFWRHKANIQRLLRGEEPKIGQKK